LGRHHPRAKFTDHFFPGLSVAADARKIQRIQGQTARLGPLIMTGKTILIQHRPMICDRALAPCRLNINPADQQGENCQTKAALGHMDSYS
jgi:hypothetical protein